MSPIVQLHFKASLLDLRYELRVDSVLENLPNLTLSKPGETPALSLRWSSIRRLSLYGSKVKDIHLALLGEKLTNLEAVDLSYIQGSNSSQGLITFFKCFEKLRFISLRGLNTVNKEVRLCVVQFT